MVDAEELQSALDRVRRSEQRGVTVEHAEIVDRSLLQPTAGAGILRIIGPLAELVQSTSNAALEVRHHAAQMVGDDLQIRLPVKQTREEQPTHRHRRFVRPAERPPEVVLRARLARVVCECRGAGRMHPDRQVDRRHALEHLQVFRLVERLPVHIREHLHTSSAELVDGAPDLAHRRLRVVHRQRGDEAGEAVGIALDQPGHLVIGQPRQVGREVRPGDVLERWRRERQHLRVAFVAVHDLEALLHVDHHWNVLDALDHQSAARRNLHQAVEKRTWQDVRENIDLEHARSQRSRLTRRFIRRYVLADQAMFTTSERIER